VLKEYPAVRVKLEAIAAKRLAKHKKPLSETVNMLRCKSAPDIIESIFASKIETKCNLKRNDTLPTHLITCTDNSFASPSVEMNKIKKHEDTSKKQPEIKSNYENATVIELNNSDHTLNVQDINNNDQEIKRLKTKVKLLMSENETLNLRLSYMLNHHDISSIEYTGKASEEDSEIYDEFRM
jgi:hypothetical protein